jgi:single-strand DNA-binding protein
MPAQQKKRGAAEAAINEVRLVGRISQAPEERTLPSGDVLWTFRVVVPRPPASGRGSVVDALECAAWTSRARRSVASWQADDVVEVSGAVRRRFFRTMAGGAASRVEVEVSRGRLIRRAATG